MTAAVPQTPICRHAIVMYRGQMRRRPKSIIVEIGVPILAGQFLFDWTNSGLMSALGHFTVRAILLFSLLLLWAVFREHRDRKKQMCR
jgi:hypothetical protein